MNLILTISETLNQISRFRKAFENLAQMGKSRSKAITCLLV
jgi:hypothetical protein